ncbi:MAG: GTP-binding protein [Acidimicrobiales bacterium]
MGTLNLGILAHVDAGKTSLTERLLYRAGVIDAIGSVDQGSTQTDSLALERQRGITIKSAVVSFFLDDVKVNLIDTPGHPDFIAEVERVLDILDGAVLVISAVEGVQSQTRILMRVLQRLHIPTLLFVNKIDRLGASSDRVLQDISDKLTPAIIAMGTTTDLGTRGAQFVLYDEGNPAFRARMAGVLATRDDALLAAYVADEASISPTQLREALAAQTKHALVHPVFFGSAILGAGVDDLTTGIRQWLPAAERDADGHVAGTVFKVERGPSRERIAFVRMFSGTLRVRDRIPVRDGDKEKITAISVFDNGSVVAAASVSAGHIAKLWGLSEIQVGDAIGEFQTSAERRHFASPTLETVIVPREAAQKNALRAALDQLSEQDPLINVRQDDVRQEMYLSLYGEVQREVIQETLAGEFGIEVEFRGTTTICIERPIGTGAAIETLPGGRSSAHPFLAGVGLRVDPAPIGSGVELRLEIERGSLPHAFLKAVEETVHATLRQGLYGWEVTDCTVTMTHSGYSPRQSASHGTFDKNMSSTAGDFRNLTPVVLMDALKQSGTSVHEPVLCYRLEIPTETLRAMLPVLARLQAVPGSTSVDGPSSTLEGTIPVARLHELQQQLPELTSGEGFLESRFDSYLPVQGPAPSRPRTKPDPLKRKEYLLYVVRREWMD